MDFKDWCKTLGFEHPNPDVLRKELLKSSSQLQTFRAKTILNRLTTHFRTKAQADIIRKQCLLHDLKTSNPDHKIEVDVRSLKEFNNYSTTKSELDKLNTLRDEIEEKKASLREQINKLDLARKKYVKDEENLYSKAYKLNQLQKKKVSVGQFIDTLNKKTDVMRLLIEKPMSVLTVDQMTDLDFKAVTLLRALTPGSEYKTILTKLSELPLTLKPLPDCDKSNMLHAMEKLYLSEIEKLSLCRATLAEKKALAKEREKEILSLVNQEFNSVDEISRELENIKEDFLRVAKEEGSSQSHCEPPSALRLERNICAVLQKGIKEKLKKISDLLPIADKPLTEEAELEILSPVMPLQLPIEELNNSLQNEISLFMNMSLKDSSSEQNNLKTLDLESSIHCQHLNLKENMRKCAHVMSLIEHLMYLSTSSLGTLNPLGAEFKPETQGGFTDLQLPINNCEDLLSKVTETYERLKSTFNFWRKEVLNKKLTGFEIEGEDVNTLLQRYLDVKERLDHEEWLLSQK